MQMQLGTTGLVSLRITIEGIPELEPGQGCPMLVGDCKALGAWNPEGAVEMTACGCGAWATEVLVSPGPLEFKVSRGTAKLGASDARN